MFELVMNRLAGSLLTSIVAHIILISVMYLLIPRPEDMDAELALSVELLKARPKPISRRLLGKERIRPRPRRESPINPVPFKTMVETMRDYTAEWRPDMDVEANYRYGDVDLPELPLSYNVRGTTPFRSPRSPIRRLRPRPKEFHLRKDEGSPGISSLFETTPPPDLGVLISLPVKPLREFLEEVRKRIEKNKFYPLEARRAGYEGTVLISFEVFRDGRIGDVRVLKSSGYELLDRAGVEAVRRASPFPKLSSYTYRKRLRIKVPITFKIEG